MTSLKPRQHIFNVNHTSTYYRIQPSIPSNPWLVDLPGFTRKTIVSICRLRFGHHCLPATLARFLSDLSPYCPFHPHTLTLSIPNHILLECPNLLPSIKKFENLLSLSDALRPWSVATLLTTKDPLIYHAFTQFLSQLPISIQI